MSESETINYALSHSPSLVLVAPKPRRPIALVARRHHHRHSSSQSHPRSSRKPSIPSSEEAKDSIERVASPNPNVRTVGHPYPRAKTPSSANAVSSTASPTAASLAGITGWPLGLGISQVSPPPRSKASSRESTRPLSRLSFQDGAVLSPSLIIASAESANKLAAIPDKVEDRTDQIDEPMLASPPLRSQATSQDVERTPTKSKGTAHPKLVSPSPHLRARKQVDDDQETRSTPTIGTLSPRQDDSVHGLTLSPTSPTEQRITAAASATAAQLALPLSSPPAVPAAVASSVNQLTRESPRGADLALASASITPSPSLSESHSRSPSASPSPCPSPGFATLLDPHMPPKYAEDEPRTMSMPLPPLPSSPIPRKMTRNPFERYLSVHAARDGCTLHARLAVAISHNTPRPSSVLKAMERQISSDMAQVDEDMSFVAISSPALSSTSLLSVPSGHMDLE